MNIFVLDTDPILAAQYHADQHLNKMILEGAQMMSTACQLLWGRDFVELYDITHPRHPCTKWLMSALANREWFMMMMHQLERERTFRFDSKVEHRSMEVARHAHYLMLKWDKKVEMTPFVLAMPDKYKCDDPVKSYRDYYMGEKMKLKGESTWTRRGCPHWMGK